MWPSEEKFLSVGAEKRIIFVGCVAGMGIIFCRFWPRWGFILSVVAEKEKLPWLRGFTINAQFRLCMNFCTLFFPFPSIIRLWLGGFFNLKKKIPVAPLFCFIPVCYLVAAERNSELSVSACVGVVLWLLFCLFLVSVILIPRCLNVLG